jgi:asparagine synthase (glutamine-hydrolysing)
VRATLNAQAVPEFLATRFVSGEETMFRGIRKVLPGHTLRWSRPEGVRTRRYWQVPAPNSVHVDAFAQEAASLRVRLEGAVRRHLMSDVPLGVFLSGGIDSSALAAMASKMVDEPLRTFSVGFAELEANELPYARLAAQHIGAQHREVVVSPGDFFEALPRLVWHEDEPIAFTSSVPLYFVSKLAAGHVKVVLTGEGADELFLGYTRYLVTLWNARLGRSYGALTTPGLRRAVRRSLERLPRRMTRYTQRTFLALDPSPRDLFFENFAVFSTSRQQGLLANDLAAGRDPYAVALACYDRAGGGTLDRMSHADLQTYLHELLMKQDQMSMAASIESRVPFLDDDLIGHVPALPAWVKLRGRTTKAVLRAAVGDLVPTEILHRKKMGFPVPIGRWLRGEFWSMVERFVLSPRALDRGLFVTEAVTRLAAEHRRGQVDHGDRLWLLMNLEIWQRVFCDGDDPAQLTRTG